MPRIRPAAISSFQLVTGAPLRAPNASTPFCSFSMISIASSCLSFNVAAVRAYSLSAVSAICRQSSRDALRSPPLASVEAARERGGGFRVVVTGPVVDEADVLPVLPLVRRRLEPLLQERNGLIGTSRSVRITLGQEDGAEPVRDVEPRIKRGADIEERIQQVERDGRIGSQCGGWRQESRTLPLRLLCVCAVVLQRANPVHVGDKRTMREHETAGGASVQVECFLIANGQWIPRVAQHLQADGDRTERDHCDDCVDDRQPRPSRHLKSLREKMVAPRVSNIATYTNPYAIVTVM